MQEDEDRFVCLKCGTSMPYDWMACPECGWKATDVDEDDEEEEADGPLRSGLSGPWVKWAAWLLVLALLVLVLLGLF